MKPVFLLLFLLTTSFSSLEAQNKRNKRSAPHDNKLGFEASIGAGLSSFSANYTGENTLTYPNFLTLDLTYKKHSLGLNLMGLYSTFGFRDTLVPIPPTIVLPYAATAFMLAKKDGPYYYSEKEYYQSIGFTYTYKFVNTSKIQAALGLGFSSLLLEWSDSKNEEIKTSKTLYSHSYFRSYFNEVSLNYNLDASVHYKISKKIGLGLKYTAFINKYGRFSYNLNHLLNLSLCYRVIN